MENLKQYIFQYNRPNDSKVRLLIAGFCILVINLLGYFTGNYHINAVSSLGVFTFLHYTPNEGSRILKRMTFVGICLLSGYMLGMLSTVYILMGPIIIALVGLVSRLLFRLFDIDKPGDLFVILCSAVGASRPVSLSEIPELSLLFIFGVVLSLIMGYVALKIEGAPKQSLSFNLNLRERVRNDPRAMVDSVSYAITLFFASYINLAIGLDQKSWLIVSAAAILQGNTLLQMYGRNFQRIIGTSLGLIVAILLMFIPFTIEVRIALIVIVYVIVEYFMPRNYSIGIFFVTNMVMLQTTLTDPSIWPSIAHSRFFGIVIGSLIGAASAFIQYRLFDFYSQTIINERTYSPDNFKEHIDPNHSL